MNKIIKLAIFSFVILGTSLGVNAQKFGYVDSQSIIQSIPSVKEANSSIETYGNQLQKKGKAMVEALQNKYIALQNLQESGGISRVELEKKAAELKQEEVKIGEFEQSSQKKIYEKTETLLKPIREQIQKAIKDVAAEGGYTYIFDYSLGFVLYADQSANINDMVRAKLGLK